MSGPTGTVTQEADGVRVRLTRHWPFSAADVWSALTDADRTPRWIGRYDGQRSAGAHGTFTMTHEEPTEDGLPADPMTVLECAAPHRLVVRWVQEGDQGWQVDVDLADDDGRTTLTATQLLPSGTDGTDVALGWHWYLDKLEAELTGGPGPAAWADVEAAVRPDYA